MIKSLGVTVLLIFYFTVLAGPAYAQTMEREVEMQFDGDIEYVSESGGPAGRTVLHMEGEGSTSVEMSTEVNGDSLNHSVSGQSEDITVTSGVKFYNGDLHVTQAKGDSGWSHNYSGEINTFPTITIDTEDTTYGNLQRVIDMENEQLWVKERFSVTGFSWIRDMLRFTPATE